MHKFCIASRWPLSTATGTSFTSFMFGVPSLLWAISSVAVHSVQWGEVGCDFGPCDHVLPRATPKPMHTCCIQWLEQVVPFSLPNPAWSQAIRFAKQQRFQTQKREWTNGVSLVQNWCKIGNEKVWWILGLNSKKPLVQNRTMPLSVERNQLPNTCLVDRHRIVMSFIAHDAFGNRDAVNLLWWCHT